MTTPSQKVTSKGKENIKTKNPNVALYRHYLLPERHKIIKLNTVVMKESLSNWDFVDFIEVENNVLNLLNTSMESHGYMEVDEDFLKTIIIGV